jgi:predicted phage terminase large subunit-like protein
MAEALSEVARKNVWDWFTGTAYNRLQPGGAIVVINHRMHEDDLSGRLLAQQAAGGDRWHVVELPAINEAGEALWPDAYPISSLERIRKNTLPRFWSALYQQKPSPEEGNFFKAEWLRTYTKLPPLSEMRTYGGSDYAVTEDDGDWTVHAVVGLDADNRMYLLDLWRDQAASDAWVESFCDLVLRWRPLAWAEETGQIRAGVGPFLTRRMRERHAYVVRELFPTRGDKAVRAQSIRGRVAMDGLYLPADAPWLAEFRHELLTFPASKTKDQVDAIGLVGQLLDRMIAGKRPVAEKPPSKGLADITLNQLWKHRETERQQW